jgi:hypothetical protein
MKPSITTRALTLVLSAPLMTGCGLEFVPFPRHHASCLFGGNTAAENVACATKHWGEEGAIFAAQQNAARGASDCKDFVLRMAKLLPGREVGVVYTKPGLDDVAHVSAIVHTKEGDFVADNGYLDIPGNVMAYDEFKAWYGEDYGLNWLADITRPGPGEAAHAALFR